MKIELLFGHWSLSFRKTLDFASLWTDPRGLTGSELGCVRIAAELAKAGHEVTIRTVSNDQSWEGCRIASIDQPIDPCDAVISINEPDLLRGAPEGAFRVCAFWLNDVSFCKTGFHEYVDLFCSPSAGHLDQMMTNPRWRHVEVRQEYPEGKSKYDPDPAKWSIVPLGCDPERYEGIVSHMDGVPYTAIAIRKIPGRVVYCSSPDRGLHWLMQEWPKIKAAVPHATLHVFYHLERWLRAFDQTPFFPPIEGQRARALYVEEALRRFADRGGLGVTLRDSVSRETIEREMAEAEVLAYPCQTVAWSEGFSCTLLEGCAARACPITTDCDALGGIYGDVLPLTNILTTDGPGEWVPTWSNAVIRALTDEPWRNEVNNRAEEFARGLTWKRTAARILEEIEKRRA